MNVNEFNSIFDKVKSTNPLWLEGEMEPKATDDSVSFVESKLGVKLASQFVEFIKNFGSGYFGFTNVFSVDPDGEWYLLDVMDQFSFPEKFIPVSDDETGGYFGFLVDENNCSEGVYYWHSSDGIDPKLKYESFYDYLVDVGLKK